VTYWGPCDDYICSGSDSGHIFIWERASARLVRVLEADEHACNGIVPHPHLPLLASYGIDSQAKLWAPSPEQAPPAHDTQVEQDALLEHNLACVYSSAQLRGHFMCVQPRPPSLPLRCACWRRWLRTDARRTVHHHAQGGADCGRPPLFPRVRDAGSVPPHGRRRCVPTAPGRPQGRGGPGRPAWLRECDHHHRRGLIMKLSVRCMCFHASVARGGPAQCWCPLASSALPVTPTACQSPALTVWDWHWAARAQDAIPAWAAAIAAICRRGRQHQRRGTDGGGHELHPVLRALRQYAKASDYLVELARRVAVADRERRRLAAREQLRLLLARRRSQAAERAMQQVGRGGPPQPTAVSPPRPTVFCTHST
jgi:hypothetical protein